MSRLAELLLRTQTTSHSFELMWVLVAGHAEHPRALTPPRSAWQRWLTRLWTSGWLGRALPSFWMTMLIVFVMVVTWVLVWRPGGQHWPLGATALAVFALWCLSFFPGWLYVRFLGRRAGALWDEYVLDLHRLAWDQARYLPRPPETSDFYEEWVHSGGFLYAYRQNIYREKFNAYYGQSVATTDSQSRMRSKLFGCGSFGVS